MASPCGHRNEVSGVTKYGEFLDWLMLASEERLCFMESFG